jgi:hypothetical protein
MTLRTVSPSKVLHICGSPDPVAKNSGSSHVVYPDFEDQLENRRTVLVESSLCAVVPRNPGISSEVFRSSS